MTEDTRFPFDLPAVSQKKVTADFGGGLISSDDELVLLRAVERRLGLAALQMQGVLPRHLSRLFGSRLLNSLRHPPVVIPLFALRPRRRHGLFIGAPIQRRSAR